MLCSCVRRKGSEVLKQKLFPSPNMDLFDCFQTEEVLESSICFLLFSNHRKLRGCSVKGEEPYTFPFAAFVHG